MPATCLRQGRRCYWRYPPANVNVCRRHAADIAGCLDPCRRLTGKVELSSTLPVCRRCFRPLRWSELSFFQCECPSAADAKHPSVNIDDKALREYEDQRIKALLPLRNFFSNLSRNAVARQVAGELHSVTWVVSQFFCCSKRCTK